MKLSAYAALCAGALSIASQPAVAAGDAAAGLQAMRELNLIVFGDLAAINGQEVEGKTFVGGNLSGNATNWGIGNGSQGAALSDWRTLTVNGNNGNSGQVNNGSNGGSGNVATQYGALIGGNSGGFNFNADNALFDVGGNLSGFPNMKPGQVFNVGGNAQVSGTGGATVNAGGTISGSQNGAVFTPGLGIGWNAASTSAATGGMLTTLQSDLEALSSHLAGLTLDANPSSITMGGQGPIFNAVAGGNDYALFSFSAAQFGPEMNFNVSDPNLTIIVNVAGTDIDWNMNAVGGYNSSLNQNIIWNFFEAETIDFAKIVHGSVLAPFATISNVTPIEGSVVALAMNMAGEVHLGTYDGEGVPFGPPPPPAVPEPATWAMFILGFGAIGGALRRRERIARTAA